MSDKVKLFLLAILMGAVTVLVIAISFIQMYRTTIQEELTRLQESADIKARLIEAVARFDMDYNPRYPGGPRAATLAQIVKANESSNKIRGSREFVVALQEKDSIRFVISHNHSAPRSLPFNSPLAEPMKMALRGMSGTIIAKDYDGITVLAAYEPVKLLDMGIVVKIDLKEVRQPFIRSGFFVSAISLVIVLLASFVFRQVSLPIVRRLKAYSGNLETLVKKRTEALHDSESKFRGIFEGSPFSILTVDYDGEIIDVNQAGAKFLHCDLKDFRVECSNIQTFISDNDWHEIRLRLTEIGSLNEIPVDVKTDETGIHPSRISATTLEVQKDGKPVFQLIIRDLSQEIAFNELSWKNEVLDKFKILVYSTTMEFGKKNADEFDINECIQSLAKVCYEIIPMRAIAFFYLDKETGKLINEGLYTNSVDLESMKSANPGFTGKMHLRINSNTIVENAMHAEKIVYLENFTELSQKNIIEKHFEIYKGCPLALVPIQPYGEIWGLAGIVYEKYMPVENLLDDVKLQIEISIQYLFGIRNRLADRKKIEELASYPLNNPQPTIGCDLEGNIIYSNKACRVVLESNGQNPNQFHLLLPEEKIRAAVEQFKKKYKGYSCETRFGDKTFLWSAHIIPSIYQIHFYSVDITQLKRTQESLVAAKEKAESADKLKSHFLQNISHEIRTPLNAIIGYSDLIATQVKEKLMDDELFFIQAIQNGGERLLRTMHEILDVATLTAGAYEPHFQVFDICDLLKKIETYFSKQAGDKSLEFHCKCHTDRTKVKYDFNSLFFAASNLVDNAIKYTEKGSVTVSVVKNRHNLIFSVTDTGIGIDSAYLNNMYDPFTQGSEGISKKFQGVGLGLSIARQYLDINKIPISVESEIGKGTTFQLTLKPAQQTDAKA